MKTTTCPCCDEPLTPEDTEPVFLHPHPYVDLDPEDQNACHHNTELCVTHPRTERQRFFLRAVMPAPVRGRERPLHWGVWVELESIQMLRHYAGIERDPKGVGQTYEVTLANRLPGYDPTTVGLEGTLTLTGPTQRPSFSPTAEHPLTAEVAEPVPEHRVNEWMRAMEASGGI